MYTQSGEEARVIAKATKRSKRSTAAAVNPFPPIAVTVTSEHRRRVERCWDIHNKVQPVTASKSSMYRTMIELGLQVFEKEIIDKGWDREAGVQAPSTST